MNKKRKLIDKVLMGAVIGGAIGSVIGASISKKNPERGVTKTDENGNNKVQPKEGFFKSFLRKILLSKKQRALKNAKKIPNEMETRT